MPATLREPLVVQALEELKMLAQTDMERERYESRRKAQMDDQTRLRVARLEGRQEGRDEGRIEGEIALIHLCERMLNRPETATEELATLSIEELARRAAGLQEQALKQNTRN